MEQTDKSVVQMILFHVLKYVHSREHTIIQINLIHYDTVTLLMSGVFCIHLPAFVCVKHFVLEKHFSVV